ncbi:glycosyltransferase [Desmospora profundinema]|uniref:Glycosyltransferase involved in cell wall biosynthesis n=1 Tax=Desmospora profundinema TaxID=1571184 RepID=A0ABU1INZ1_9BACL|nr:glycosyltransferase [Desmospora profundinema]MDR6225674.1 glycosyltransferase involved in cell wall biosynthesis [Desmospora profundinema]
MNATSQTNTGVSIITCTKRASYINHLFNNYHRQRWPNKELIIILNKDSIAIDPYRETAKKYRNVSIYRLPENVTLGECLNFGVKRSRYGYIAKFDDDDFYSPFYLTDYMQISKTTYADIIGKRTHYVWLQGPRVLILRQVRSPSLLPGATLFIKKQVFNKVRFPNRNVGEDDQFCRDCKAKGFKLVSAGKHHFVAVRRKHSQNHTWIISDKELLSSNHTKIVARIKGDNG